MNPDAAPPASRYRNDAIFRSAERLLATPPKSPVRRTSPWPAFALGLAAGLVVSAGLFVVLINYTTPAGGPAAARNRWHWFSSKPATPPPGAVAAPASTTPAVPAAASSTPASALGKSSLDRSRVAVAHPVPTRSTTVQTGETLSRPVQVYGSLKLHGELRAEGSAPAAIEFALYRLSTGDPPRVLGQVRYLRDDQVVAENTVIGRLDGRTITLQEDRNLRASVVAPVGRVFSITLPAVTDLISAPLAGTWNYQGQSGTLALSLALPW